MLNKIIKSLILIFCIFFGVTLKLNADNIIDFDKKGNIKVTLIENSENVVVEGAEITIYKVADATEYNNNLKFEYVDEIKSCDFNLEDLENSNATSEILKCITKDVLSITKSTNDKGIVTFDNLDLGLYIVTQSNKVEGFSVIDSFLVMIPNVIDNEWIYDISALPKTDIYKGMDHIINKVWNTVNENLPHEILVNLYKNDEVIETVVLNEENNWSYTFEDIEASDEYYIKEVNVPKGYIDSYQIVDNVFTIINSDKLPQTGQIFYPIVFLIISGVIFILIGIIILKREFNNA